MSWNIKTPGDYINGPLTVAGNATFNSNVGIGLSPSAWAGLNGKVLEFGYSGGSASLFQNGSNDTHFTSNAYFNGSNWVYAKTGTATRYLQLSGAHYWYNAPSGTAGNTITGGNAWINSMILDGSANLSVAGSYVRAAGRTQIGAGYIGDIFAQGNNMGVFFGSNALLPADGAGNAVNNTQNLGTTNYRWDKVHVGTGINFPTAQIASADANTLDDYEEGTWTGTVKGSISDPTTPLTATGRYTKVGRQVSVQIEFNNVSTVGASGSIYLLGLPFTNSTAGGCPGSVISYLLATFTETLGCIAGGNGTGIDLYSVKSNSAWVQATHNAGTGRYLWINITYTV